MAASVVSFSAVLPKFDGEDSVPSRGLPKRLPAPSLTGGGVLAIGIGFPKPNDGSGVLLVGVVTCAVLAPAAPNSTPGCWRCRLAAPPKPKLLGWLTPAAPVPGDILAQKLKLKLPGDVLAPKLELPPAGLLAAPPKTNPLADFASDEVQFVSSVGGGAGGEGECCGANLSPVTALCCRLGVVQVMVLGAKFGWPGRWPMGPLRGTYPAWPMIG